jgi:hypothetical protein
MRLASLVEEVPADVLTRDGRRYGKKYDEWCAARPGKLPFLPREIATLTTMLNRVQGHAGAGQTLYGLRGANEYSVIWHDADTGLDLRCRFDRIVWMPDGKCLLADIKTTRQSESEFGRDIVKYGYMHQAAFYWKGAQAIGQMPDEWRFVCVQNCEPYDAWVWSITADDSRLVQAMADNQATLRELARRLETNDWDPETYGLIRPVPELPGWGRELELTISGRKVRI